MILHVFTDGPAVNRWYSRTKAHRNICQVQLPQYAWAEGPPDFLPEAFPGRCLAPLRDMADREVNSLLQSAARYRLERKALRLSTMSAATSVEQAMFQGVAEALGFHQNKLPMAVIAQRCSLEMLRKLDRETREALLFGCAGFLNIDGFKQSQASSDRVATDYLRELWDRWWTMRATHELAPHRAPKWSFTGSRPANHPQRRIAALATVIDRWDELFTESERMVNNWEEAVNNSLKSLSHPFWDQHFTLRSATSPRPIRLIGGDRLRDILGNVVIPAKMGAGGDCWDDYTRLRGVDSNQKLRRAALRLFGPDRARQKLFTTHYHQQQGLLQIYDDLCLKDLSECTGCPFPEQLRQWSAVGEAPRLREPVGSWACR